jgi:threonine dehydrogenase-like Zn-dependent dehydrogenase
MKTLTWTGPRTMTLEDAPRPEIPEGWVLLRVKAAGICGSEIAGYLGHNELRVPPLVMGHEFSAVVEALGIGASGISLGTLVTVNPLVSCGRCRHCRQGERQRCADRQIIGINFPGAYAEWVVAPASQCYPVRDPLLGAMVEPLACALRAVHQARVSIGDRTLVVGAGIIGLMTARLLAMAGAAEIVVADPNPARRAAASAFGASNVLADFGGLEDFDVVVDAVGLDVTRRETLKTLSRGGRAVWIGLHQNDTTVPGNALVRNETIVSGSFCYRDEEFSRAVALMNAGQGLPTERNWLDVRPLAVGNAAFAEQATPDAPYAKILLTL